MSTNRPKVFSREDILNRLPIQVLSQKVYKAKVVFMGVLRDDPNYNQVRSFSVNGRRYSVVDSGISYLPEEALRALQDAVPVYTVHANSQQAKDGVNHGDPSDQFRKMPNPRYNITILEEFQIGKDEAGNNVLVSLTDQSKEEELQRAQKAAYEAMKKELEEDLRIEIEEKVRKELSGKMVEEDYPDVKIKEEIPEAMDDDEFEELISGEE